MAQQAAGCGGGNNNSENGDDVTCVFRAVAAGETAARVREFIDAYASARGSDDYEAVNYKSSFNGDTPLWVAHQRLLRGDLVGVLLENGADATALVPRCKALALAIHHGLTETMCALLRSGRHEADETLAYGYGSSVRWGSGSGGTCLPVHIVVVPPKQSSNSHDFDLQPPPRIEAIEVLVREFGADVNGRDKYGRTPLHWAAWAAPGHQVRAVDALVARGAAVSAGADVGRTPVSGAAYHDPSMVLRFLSLGSSTDVLDTSGWSPLTWACMADEPTARVTVPALLRASSRETRRAVGRNCIRQLVQRGYRAQCWCRDAIGELLSSGASVHPSNAARVLPFAARHATRLDARVAEHEHDTPPWQVHESMVELAFYFQDVRAVEEGVRVRETRAQELEEALRALGVGTEDTHESDEEEGDGEEGGEEEGDESDEEEEEGEEAGASGGSSS